MNVKISKTAFADLNEKNKDMLDAIKKNKEALAAELRTATPKNLKKWLDANGNIIIQNIIENGQSVNSFYATTRKLDRHKYGYNSLKEFANG